MSPPSSSETRVDAGADTTTDGGALWVVWYAYGHVGRHVYGHVHGHVGRHVCRHVCGHVYGHEYRHVL